MPRIDSEKFYSQAIKKFPDDARALHWTSNLTQELRFEILLELLPDDLSALSIGDAGCGFGDFYNYLRKNSLTPHSYVGIDIHDEMCHIARKNCSLEILKADICKEPIPVVDFYVCSGALNILSEFETRLFIHNCYKSSRIGFIFNALHGEDESEVYNYITTQRIQEIAKELGVKEPIFRTDYLDSDITIGFFR